MPNKTHMTFISKLEHDQGLTPTFPDVYAQFDSPKPGLVIPPKGELAPHRSLKSPYSVYIAKLSEGSRRSQRKACLTVAQMAGWGGGPESFPWASLRYEHVQALRTALSDRYAPATANRHLSAIRGVLKESWRLGQVTAEDYQRAIMAEPVKSTTVLRGRVVPAAELAALAHICQKDASPRGPRDAAILALGYAGLRRAEIVGLEISDFDRVDSHVQVRAGKGRKDRTVAVHGGVVDALEAWIAQRGEEPGPLLCRVHKGGRIEVSRLTTQAIYRVCARLATEAGVRPFTPHDMRRTCVSTHLDNGIDLGTVAEIVGHSSTDTTRRYDLANSKRRKKAAEALVFPYTYRG